MEGADYNFAGEALRRQLASAGTATLRMSGVSMTPVLPDGARVTLRRCRSGEDLQGALVAVEHGGRVVVHRVTLEAEGHITTQGITRPRADPPTTPSDVIGVVCARGKLRSENLLRAAAAVTQHLYLRARAVRSGL